MNASLIVLAWILSICEPYGLRLRNCAMGYYYPARARVRAVWLYNHILRSRGSFLKYARRQLRRMLLKDGLGIEKITFMDRLRAAFPIVRKIFKGKKLEACLLCGGLGSSTLPLVKCPRPDCVGIYCVPCYGQLQNICTLCKLPIEYGDLSDMSEERDSSEVTSLPATEEASTTGESNMTDAVLADTAESELSYGYQFKNRDVEKDKSLTTTVFKDVEAQKPLTRATINDFAFPIEHHPEEDEHKLTLSQRRKSGFWSLIVDADDEKKKPTATNLTPGNIPSTETQQAVQEKKEADKEVSEGREIPPAISKSKIMMALKKLFELPRLRRVKKKDETDSEQEESEKTDEDSEVKKTFFSTPSKISVRSNKPQKRAEGHRIDLLKKKLFGEGVGLFKKPDSSKSESEGISIPTVTSKESKSSKMIENWVKTGKYHESDVVQGELQPMLEESNIPSVPSSETKQPKGFINLFRRIFGKREDKVNKDTVSATTTKHSADTLSGKKDITDQTLSKGSIWKFWRKKEVVHDHLIPTEKQKEVEESTVLVDEITAASPSVQLISLVSFEEVPFTSMKRVQTPAKIVHERFKIDEENDHV